MGLDTCCFITDERLAISQTVAIPLNPSWVTVARCLPSGENATTSMPDLCSPNTVSPTPVSISQIRTVLSLPPEAICLLSGEKAMELTCPVWPVSVLMLRPLAASQILMVQSVLPEPMYFPSGEKATGRTPSVWPVNFMIW